MNFIKLRLSGFKSFVDPMELLIERGLTGVVGPNGCGKSNLVEALRWVMGENSAKRLRGGAMDDVIFNGSQNRGSRNLAEVSLTIDNGDRTAPASVNDASELEVTRVIERNGGSAYSINGSEMRARDVQLLFADAASGAHSPSLVSQGRIGEVINAKPVARRSLIEEAAGITGLHSRRHEAELRLKAAENNLERLDDVMQALDAQLQNMRRQARQAKRYRRIGEQIRYFDGIQLHLSWQQADEQLSAADEVLGAANFKVAKFTEVVAEATASHIDAGNDLPMLRQVEVAAAATLHRLAVARDSLDQEERRIAENSAQIEARLAQIHIDQQREKNLGEEANSNKAILVAEFEQLRAKQMDEQRYTADAEAIVQNASSVLSDNEVMLEKLTNQLAQGSARAESLRNSRLSAEQRRIRLTLRQDDAEVVRTELKEEIKNDSSLHEAKRELDRSSEAAEMTSVKLENFEAQFSDAEDKLNGAREISQQLDVQDAQLAAEERALTELLRRKDADLWPAVIDAVTVQRGFEAALGVALGDDLDVPTDEAAPMHWRTLAVMDNAKDLPKGATPLSRYVTAPAALARRLSQIGVADDQDAPVIASKLAYGQRLVTTRGALWRWDGLTIMAGAETAAAVRLAQGNRLAEIGQKRTELAPALANAAKAYVEARQDVTDIANIRTTAREAARLSREEAEQARNVLANIEQYTSARSTRLAAAIETLTQVQADLEETETVINEADIQLEALPSLEVLRKNIEGIRSEAAIQRTDLLEARSQYEIIRREATLRIERILAIELEQGNWRRRAEGAEVQLSILATRIDDGVKELEILQRRPAQIAKERSALLDQIEVAEVDRNHAAEILVGAEDNLKNLATSQRRSEVELGTAREDRVRSQANVEQCVERRAEVVRRIREALHCEPGVVLERAGVGLDVKMPSLEEAQSRLTRLKRERDNMGAVNLRAEEEATELDEQLTGMMSEKSDLGAAITRLRQGIYSLNKEGRERLLTAYEAVDGHFQDLFVRLFGGGKAHLSLTESDDPLEAGLEIMASPPGKRLQSLSLLSGGEQAMTALALLFAVFLTKPAPVCVLDEVDAPLDDANVERFTSLVSEIAEITGTRFLIITHHPYTMARMDRLFGVTMSERGISQLVSVDLARAERIRLSG